MKIEDQIPGLREAIDREQHIRDVSFIELPEVICGFDVQPLTLRHIIVLGSVGSPFVRGGYPLPVDAGAFLCVVGNWRGFNRWRNLKRLGKVPMMDAVESIGQYMSESFQDAPGISGVDSVSYYSFAASLIDLLAHEYGWNERDILDMPVKRLFQYVKAIAERHGEKTFFNPSDKVRGDWMREVNKN